MSAWIESIFGDEDDQTPTANNVVHSPDAKDIAPGTLRLPPGYFVIGDGPIIGPKQ